MQGKMKNFEIWKEMTSLNQVKIFLVSKSALKVLKMT
jgi:hypothetical protein